MDYKELHKSRRIPSLADLFAKRHQDNIAERNEKRREMFWVKRGCVEVASQSEPDPLEVKKSTRAEKLKKWKEEKQKKMEEVKKKQKPAFKVGILQRKVTGSPLLNQKTGLKKGITVRQNVEVQIKGTQGEKMEGVVTRSRARRMEVLNPGTKPVARVAETKKVVKPQVKLMNKFCKIDTGKIKQVNSAVFKVPEAVSKLPYHNLTFPYSPKMSKKNKKTMKQKQDEDKSKVEEGLNKSSVVFEKKQAEEEEKQENTQPQKPVTPEKVASQADDFVPIYYSPFVTIRSGKKSLKKDKMSLSMDVDEQIIKEEKEFQCRIFSFRKYIECETKRLLDTCEKWRHVYQEFQEVPADVEEDIDSVIGKTTLLTSDKFMQFKGLVDKCEKGDPLIKVDDLQGFQDWVSIEVERIDEDFHKLEKRKLNNWAVETSVVRVEKIQKLKAKNPTKKPVGKSNIRSHILAARKLLREGSGEGGDVSKLAFNEILRVTTPKKQSLLKEVLTSETKKKTEPQVMKSPLLRERRNSGLEIMVASQKNKFSTPTMASPKATNYEVLVTAEQTPSRSILKSTRGALSSSKGRVTFKKLGENSVMGGGLDEKYFQPVADDDRSPMRTVLGDLQNFTPTPMTTRSRSKQLSTSTYSVL